MVEQATARSETGGAPPGADRTGPAPGDPGSALPDSYWVASATPQIPLVRLEDDVEADVAIVGGGYAGLRCAIELAERGIDAALVDATEPGFGASGRSGGQVNPLPHIFPEKIREQYGNHHGELFLDTAVNAADELYGLVQRHGISCELEQNGWVQGAHAPHRMALLEERHANWTREGAEIDVLSRQEVRDLVGSDAHYGGIMMKRGGAVHPMSYTRGLAHVALAAGARIYSRTPATRLERHGERWTLHCGEGRSITANRVVLATNGYTDGLLAGLRRTVLPLVSVQAVTEPLSDAQLARVLPARTTFADTRRVIFYTRRVGGNRLAFGTLARSDGGPVQDADRRRIHLGIRQVFPELADVKWDYYWTGRVGHTPDFLPHFHEPEPGIVAGLGFNGRGVAMATVMGRVLAERAAGADPATLPFPTTDLKAIPFHGVGRLGVVLTSHWYEMLDAWDVFRNRRHA